MASEEEKNARKDAWSVNENLLQSYRNIFYSTQSILAAVGAIMVDKHWLVFALIFGVALYQIWWLFCRRIVTRARIVDYHKYNFGDYFSDKGHCDSADGKLEKLSTSTKKLTEYDYSSEKRSDDETLCRKVKVNNRFWPLLKTDSLVYSSVILRDGVNAEAHKLPKWIEDNGENKPFTNWRPTRKAFERYLPLSLTVVWLVLFAYNLYGNLYGNFSKIIK